MSPKDDIGSTIPAGSQAFDSTKPDLPKQLLRKYDYDTINWQKGAVIIIERVLDRGTP